MDKDNKTKKQKKEKNLQEIASKGKSKGKDRHKPNHKNEIYSKTEFYDKND